MSVKKGGMRLFQTVLNLFLNDGLELLLDLILYGFEV